MLQIMKDVPANVVGVRALGNVTEQDYKQSIAPALENASKQFGEINLLMIFETDLSNFTYGAWMQDAKMSLKHFAKWNKIAIVSDQKIVEKLTHLFTFISPAEAKGFPLSDIEIAKIWVSASKQATGKPS
ncbi:MAG: STAS/SEC14 domain-containing protein [Segetibacter sp.]